MRKTDVPLYLHESEFFQSLSDDDDAEIHIPEHCFKSDDSVSTCEELRLLLSTVRFWGLRELPAPSVKFVLERFCGEVSAVLEEFRNEFILSEFTRHLPTHPNERINRAAKLGAIEILRYYHSQGVLFSDYAQELALQHSNFECFKFTYEATNRISREVFVLAPQYNRLDCLQFAHEHGALWDAHLLATATLYRNMPCLQYGLDHGCPGIGEAACVAARFGYRDILEYLIEYNRGQTYLGDLANQAVIGGYECLRCVHESHGYKMSSRTMVSAAQRGDMESLKYAHEHGCQWTEQVFTQMIEFGPGCIECFKYAHQAGCPLPQRVTELAARRARIDILKYLLSLGFERTLEVSIAAAGHEMDRSLRFVHAQGCPVNLEVMRTAARTGGLYSVRYLHKDIGLQWDTSVSAAGAAGGYTFIAEYLFKSGCPWDASTVRAAAMNGRLLYLQFACENGCDYTGILDVLDHHPLGDDVRAYLEKLRSKSEA